MTKCHLIRVRLNQGGYDSSGRYWGIDRPLFNYWFDDEDVSREDYIRANNREHAITLITKIYPNLKFYRY